MIDNGICHNPLNTNPFEIGTPDDILDDDEIDDALIAAYSFSDLINMTNLTEWIKRVTARNGFITMQFAKLNMSIDVYSESNATELRLLLQKVDKFTSQNLSEIGNVNDNPFITNNNNNNDTTPSNTSIISFLDVKNSVNRFKYVNQQYALTIGNQHSNGLNRGSRKYRNFYDSRFFAVSVYQPPLTIEYTGLYSLQLNSVVLRALRLMYLPPKYFDSFTISSILNENNLNYLNSKIDRYIESSLHNICYSHLENYPTSIKEDQQELKLIESKRKQIIGSLNHHNTNKANNPNVIVNWTDYELFKNDLHSQLTELDRKSLILQYRIREKECWWACTKIKVVHKFQNRKKKRKSSSSTLSLTSTDESGNTFGSSLEQFMLDLLYGSNDEFDDNDGDATSGDDDSSDSESDGHWLVDILTQMLTPDSADLTDSIAEDDGDSLSHQENDDNELERDDDDDVGDVEDIESDDETNYVSKEKLLIGVIKQGSIIMASTKGWNSPSINNVGSGDASSMLNIANLFSGSGNTFTISGSNSNIRINGNSISIGDVNSLFNLNLNTNSNDNSGGGGSGNSVQKKKKKKDIPETIPFENMMGGTSFVAFTIDQSGQTRQIGSSNVDLGNIDIASLLGGAQTQNGQSNVVRLTNLPPQRKKKPTNVVNVDRGNSANAANDESSDVDMEPDTD